MSLLLPMIFYGYLPFFIYNFLFAYPCRWPRDALIAVSNHFLSGESLSTPDECKKELIIMMGSVHDGVARTCQEYFSVSTRLEANNFQHNGSQTPISIPMFDMELIQWENVYGIGIRCYLNSKRLVNCPIHSTIIPTLLFWPFK